MVPVGFFLQGLYRLRRGRSRVDDFFAVFVGSILAVMFGVLATLYVETYIVTDLQASGALEVSQGAWAIFLVLNVALTSASRELMREVLERRWRAGIGLKRILIAGSGDLGRLVADKILEHRELGYQIVGFVDDRGVGDHLGYGSPLLGTIGDASEICGRESIDHLYARCRRNSTSACWSSSTARAARLWTSRSCRTPAGDCAARRLEDLDGIPIININDVPLQGFNVTKRVIDVVISSPACSCSPFRSPSSPCWCA